MLVEAQTCSTNPWLAMAICLVAHLIRPHLTLTHVSDDSRGLWLEAKASLGGQCLAPGKSRALVLEHFMQLLFLPLQQGLDRNMLGNLAGPNTFRNFTSRF